jgi:uridine kinase
VGGVTDYAGWQDRGVGRDEVLAAVWASVPAPGRPVLVGMDGPDGAGKTTLADDLARVARGRPVVRASLDDFHHPRAHRHAEGRTAETVWSRGFDYDAVRRELLEPWRHGAGATYHRRWHDLATDASVREPAEVVPTDGVLVVDGVFAQRDELAGVWDLVVYVDASDAVRVARMAERDGVPADPEHPDQRRYLEAQRLYHARCDPVGRADVVLDLDDPERIRIVRTSPRTASVAQNGRP